MKLMVIWEFPFIGRDRLEYTVGSSCVRANRVTALLFISAGQAVFPDGPYLLFIWKMRYPLNALYDANSSPDGIQ